MDGIRSYRDLIVWKRAMLLAEGVYRLTRSYPPEERFGLSSQSQRAAVSVPANIAEGHGRGTKGAYAGFLRIARGSLRELETHLLLAARLHLADDHDVQRLPAECDEIGRMLHAIISRLRQTKADD